MAAVELFSTSLFSDANLVSYYRAENTSDSKGTNTLTNNNSVTFAAAKFNNGFTYGASNTNKYLSGAYTFVADNTDFTVSYWTNPGSANPQFISFASHTHEYYLGFEAGGQVDFHYTNSDDTSGDHSASITITDFTVSHLLTFTAKKSGSNWIATIYVDGVAESSPATVVSKNTGALSTINIGRLIIEASNYSIGYIDDVSIFNRALTAVEVGILLNGDITTSSSSSSSSSTSSTSSSSTSSTSSSTSHSTSTSSTSHSTSSTSSSTSSSSTSSTSSSTSSTSSSTSSTTLSYKRMPLINVVLDELQIDFRR